MIILINPVIYSDCMRHLFTLLALLGCAHFALAQKSKPAPVITRYYHFTGTIDKYPVTFHLYRINNKFSGVYYNNSTEEPIDFYGTLDKTRFLKLTRNDNQGEELEVLSGNFKDSSFSGTWSSKGKLLPFRLTQKKDSSGLTFDYIYTAGTKKLTGDPHHEELSYDAATVWPAATAAHPATGAVKQAIYKDFGQQQSTEPIGKLMISQKNDMLSQVPGKKDSEAGIDVYGMSRCIKVQYVSPKLLTLSSYGFTDGGGAHGIHGITYISIDLEHNRQLDITDVIDTLNCRKTLSSILEKKFRAAYGVKQEEKISDYLLVDVIKANHNFCITSKGILFTYNPYEIGAYVMGEISLYIPFKEVSTCLKAEFKQWMGVH